jgi:hypothetical protein
MTDPAPKDTSTQDAARLDRSYALNKSTLDREGATIDKSVQTLTDLKGLLDAHSVQADALVIPKLLSATVGGTGSGLRMTRSEIEAAAGGRSALDALRSRIGGVIGSGTIPEQQRQQIYRIVGTAIAKEQKRQALLDDAQHDLNTQADVNGHRTVVDNVRKVLHGMDAGSGGTATLVDPTTGATRQVDRTDPRYRAYIAAGAREVQ